MTSIVSAKNYTLIRAATLTCSKNSASCFVKERPQHFHFICNLIEWSNNLRETSLLIPVNECTKLIRTNTSVYLPGDQQATKDLTEFQKTSFLPKSLFVLLSCCMIELQRNISLYQNVPATGINGLNCSQGR